MCSSSSLQPWKNLFSPIVLVVGTRPRPAAFRLKTNIFRRLQNGSNIRTEAPDYNASLTTKQLGLLELSLILKIPRVRMSRLCADVEKLRQQLETRESRRAEWRGRVAAEQQRLAREAEQHGDVALVSVVDHYRNIPHKLLTYFTRCGRPFPGYCKKSSFELKIREVHLNAREAFERLYLCTFEMMEVICVL